MKFSKGNCQFLHLEKNISLNLYVLGDEQLKSSSGEKDIGILVYDE